MIILTVWDTNTIQENGVTQIEDFIQAINMLA